MADSGTTSITDEDAKLVTLARSSRARTGAAEGAAVRDETGRTYAATTVDLQALQLSALQSAIAAAVASGAQGIEGAAIVTVADAVSTSDLAVASELAVAAAQLHRCSATGDVVESVAL